MSSKLKSNPATLAIIKSYPDLVQTKLQEIRNLIELVAQESDQIAEVQETLKWGEPSYITKIGSTLRMDWKEKSPEQYALYFSCSSKLVSSFKAVFGDELRYEGNRAVVMLLNEDPPKPLIKKCIHAALHYHKLKSEQLLGL
ncbi:DUF1801 domain-containing protein [bacterium]|nr:DUF1801 domain-containing protein [bacterium]